jgi:hypothetical protein|uniref:Uncharacterized protein n=1 Tax=viral metagenome TaxID=1070528 RepID=A0A6C0H4U0_9ZZZZ
MLYVNPLGEVTNLNTSLNANIRTIPGTPFEYNYTNKINNLRKNNVLNDARLEDIEIKSASNKLYLIIYSIFACIFIIMFLVLFKKLSR